MEDSVSDVRPQKRVKLDSDQVDGAGDETPLAAQPVGQNGLHSTAEADDVAGDERKKELEVGITTFVNASRSVFRGTLKQRYTDFLVNEILPDGTVLHLQNTKPKPTKPQQSQGGDAAGAVSKPQPQNDAQTAKEKEDITPRPDREIKEEVRAEATPESPASPDTGVSDEDRTKLGEHFDEKTVKQMISLYEAVLRHPGRKPRDHPMVRTPFTSDRNIRSQIHQDIRRIFQSKLDSSTDKDGTLVLTAAALNSRSRGGGTSKSNDSARHGKLGWADRGGEYTHFSLYKENKDTLEVISFLTKQLRTNTKTFQFAGTKDRRAVTVQRVSAYRFEAERLAGLNKTLRFAAVGDFEYQKKGLELGDLSGNEFVLTLRDCSLGEPSEVTGQDKLSAVQSHLAQSLQQVRDNGFLNYYGLQRFGTFAIRTDVVGLKILQGNFKGACDAILEFSPAALEPAPETSDSARFFVGQDDRARAEGINIWKTTGRVNDALDKIPRKFSGEAAVIRHLGKRMQDYLGALLSIQRNLRLMYVHAYQSFVWNLAVGERWRLFGDKVVEGDLVLVHEHKDKEDDTDSASQQEASQTIDADGEIIIQPSGDDRANDASDMFERARALTAAQAASGAYSIFDIVMPLPGFDMLYPANASGEWYKTFMASDAGGRLDPHDMRRRQKDFSLSGGYRKILARIGADFEVTVHEYTAAEGDRQFVETDMERLQKKEGGAGSDVTAVPPPAEDEKEADAGSDSGPTEVAKDEMMTDTPTVANDENPSPLDSEQPKMLAAVLKFQLGSSQYATMALRELSRGGILPYKADFTGGR